MKTIDTLICEDLKKKEEKNPIGLKEMDYSTPNRLLEEVGSSVIHLLNDFFVSPNGPKLRDIFSHGVVHPHSIHLAIVDQILALFLFLCLKYISPEEQSIFVLF